MCFDTTASNTGIRKGACILLEQQMDKDMLWLACRHHVMEIMLEGVVTSVLPPSTGPEIVIFKKFQSKWSSIDKTIYSTSLTDEIMAEEVAGCANEVITFALNQLAKFQPRDDYRELLELTIIFLGGKLAKGISFKAPAGLHRARWMAKAIYSLKIFLFKNQFELTDKEESAIRDICLFTVRLYVKVWFTAPVAPFAPRIDLQLLKDLVRYRENHQCVAAVALKKFLGHLWYLSEELVAFAFFDDYVSAETKSKMVDALNKQSDEEPVKRVSLDSTLIPVKELEDFVTSNTSRFVSLTGIPHNFLNQNIDQWEFDESYLSTKLL